MAEEEKDIVAEKAETQAAVTAETEDGEAKKPAKKKKAWKRWLLGILIGLVVVLTLAVIFRDLVIKHSVEKAGSLIVGTPVVCGHFSSSLLGKVHIKNLTVGNPPDYHNPHAFKLGEVRVDLNISTLLSDKIEVRDVYVEGVSVDYELKFGRSNLGEIQKNLERFKPADKDNPDSADEGGTDNSKQVVIRHLKIENTALTFSNATLKTTLKMPLPGLELENLGDGKSFGETCSDFFGLIFTSINKAVTGAGGAIVDAGGAVVDAVGNAFKSLTGGGNKKDDKGGKGDK